MLWQNKSCWWCWGMLQLTIEWFWYILIGKVTAYTGWFSRVRAVSDKNIVVYIFFYYLFAHSSVLILCSYKETLNTLKEYFIFSRVCGFWNFPLSWSILMIITQFLSYNAQLTSYSSKRVFLRWRLTTHSFSIQFQRSQLNITSMNSFQLKIFRWFLKKKPGLWTRNNESKWDTCWFQYNLWDVKKFITRIQVQKLNKWGFF